MSKRGKSDTVKDSTTVEKVPPGKLTESAIAAAFTGEIPRVRVPILYRFGLLLVAVMMVLLPIAYVGLIALLCYGVYYHATENVTVLGGRGTKGRLLAYLGPLVAGGVAAIFMVKPLFARPPRQPDPVSVNPRAEPLLFRFVSSICSAVGAPLPRRIDVDCEVNASASFRRGFLSMLGNDLVLTIGLPLAAGLSLRQLAGVLAHEFGHFAQGTGMRFTYVIRSVNGWFARVVYERDAWDLKLVQWSEELDSRIGIVLYLARFMVWLTRRVLWVLMICGHVISSFMLRQMEFDADRYEARLAGSETFRSTALKLPLLHVASQKAMSDLGQSWSERRLGDELPALVAANLGRMPRKVKERVLSGVLQQRTGLFDSHPADRDRIESARREKAPGVFQLEVPARGVFRDFSALSKKATLFYYREILGPEVTSENLVPTRSLLEQQSSTESHLAAYRRYFQGCIDEATPLSLDGELPPVEDTGAAFEMLGKLREKFASVIPRARKLVERLEEEEGTLRRLEVARSLNQAGLRVDPQELGLVAIGGDAIRSQRARAEGECSALREKLRPVSRLLEKRWRLALQLLKDPRARKILQEEKMTPPVVEKLLETHSRLGGVHETLRGLNETCLVNNILANNLGENAREDQPQLVATIEARARDWQKQLTRLDDALGDVQYPFEHARLGISVARYAMEKPPPRSPEPGALFPLAGTANDRLHNLLYRVRGRLASLAERVECELLGVPPLPDPGEEEHEESEEAP